MTKRLANVCNLIATISRKLLIDNFSKGNEFVTTKVGGPGTRRLSQAYSLPDDQLSEFQHLDVFAQKEIAAQGVRTNGDERLFLVNKTADVQEIDLTNIGRRVIWAEIVEEESGNNTARRELRLGESLRLNPFAVVVLGLESIQKSLPSS